MSLSQPTTERSEWGYRIRPYEKRDREAVYRLAADSAFFGDPVEAFLDDRALFCGAFVAYYVDYEPERLWVAEVDGFVVGYVLGCGDTQKRLVVVRSRILPVVLCGLLRGRYQIGRKTLRLSWRFLLDRLEHLPPTVPLARFPGHLHINVAALARGHGIGGELLRTSLTQFWATGVPGVHLRTTDHHRAACHLYEKVGFQLLDARPTHVWRELLAYPVENRVYGIKPGWR